jgi:hypothetical protein
MVGRRVELSDQVSSRGLRLWRLPWLGFGENNGVAIIRFRIRIVVVVGRLSGEVEGGGGRVVRG